MNYSDKGWTMRGIRGYVMLVAAIALLVFVHDASAVVVTFDDLTPGPQPGDALAGLGVTFTTGNIPNVIFPGDIITFANADFRFEVFAGNAISPPNVAGAIGSVADVVGTAGKDLLIDFSVVPNVVSLQLDAAAENNANPVRLIGVTPTGTPNEFRVDTFVQAGDAAPATLALAVPSGFAIFQLVDLQPEGFDNLTFVQSSTVPEPATLLLLGGGLIALGMHRRRNRG